MSVGPPGDGSKRSTGPSMRKGGGAYEGGLQAALAVVISMGFGHWADRYFDSSPIGLFLGLAIGFGAFTLRIWQLLKSQSSAGQDSEEGPQDSGPG